MPNLEHSPRALHDLRQLHPCRDHETAALRLPEPPAYRFGGDRNRPANPVTTVGELVAWCQAERINPAPVVGHAIWSAVRGWSKGSSRETRSALTLMRAAALARIKGTDIVVSSRATGLALQAQGSWQAHGMPLLDQSSADTQRTVIGIGNARRHGKSGRAVA